MKLRTLFVVLALPAAIASQAQTPAPSPSQPPTLLKIEIAPEIGGEVILTSQDQKVHTCSPPLVCTFVVTGPAKLTTRTAAGTRFTNWMGLCTGPAAVCTVNESGRVIAAFLRTTNLPEGTYVETCSNIGTKQSAAAGLPKTTLVADCRRTDKSVNKGATLLLPCLGDIANANGALTCVTTPRPPGR
ncbi:hypothetical protein [Usitatibacter palustris]|uniref:Bacterial repeat domain-containing protein n=1 Tax=Usitatibacter palustris TaxID=2732487 RepID=A0A6M4H6T0_9PROT|nr:hypothetical protein [Usitatibacter palustris]QJR15072.1 hypothetical protein DSM104440_01888 [Usitatibacter palustris]